MHRARRLLASAVVLAALAGCSDDGSGTASPPADDEVPPTTGAPAPPEVDDPELAAFLERAEGATDAAFTATFSSLRKLGGLEATVQVAQAPPAARITVDDDLVVVTGPDPATCLNSAEACVEGVREDRLNGVGLFSAFYSTGPSQALAVLSRRPEADDPQFSQREVAGVTLECASIAVGGVVANLSCLTPEGVYGLVDNAAQRVELTAYAPTPPADPVEAPFAVGDDASFLVP